MIVYESTKQLFVEDVVRDRIEENIDRKFYEKMGYHTSESERKAQNNSMQYMMKVLIENNIPGNVGIVQTYTGHALREVAHLSYQAWSYATTIEDYTDSE